MSVQTDAETSKRRCSARGVEVGAKIIDIVGGRWRAIAGVEMGGKDVVAGVANGLMAGTGLGTGTLKQWTALESECRLLKPGYGGSGNVAGRL